MTMDIRWQQRFANFQSVLIELTSDIHIANTRKLSIMEEKGLIKTFEFTFELAWNCLKDLGEYQGITNIIGSRDAIRFAFKNGLIEDGEVWMDMIESRIKTAHTYHRELANQIGSKIINQYYAEFIKLQKKLTQLLSKKP